MQACVHTRKEVFVFSIRSNEENKASSVRDGTARDGEERSAVAEEEEPEEEKEYGFQQN